MTHDLVLVRGGNSSCGVIPVKHGSEYESIVTILCVVVVIVVVVVVCGRHQLRHGHCCNL